MATGNPEGKKQPPEEQRLGPVLRRRGQVTASTTDQRLLDAGGPSDWVHTDPWRVLRIQSEFIEGFGTLAELPPAISVFGSARTPSDSPEYEAGVRLGRGLVEAGFAVITAQPASTRPRPRRTPASYSGESAMVRAEPKTLIAGGSSASVPKPSMNSDWMRRTRQGSVCTQSDGPPASSSRWSVVLAVTCPRLRRTGPRRCSSGGTFLPSGFPVAMCAPSACGVFPPQRRSTRVTDGGRGRVRGAAASAGRSPRQAVSHARRRSSPARIFDVSTRSSRLCAKCGFPGP